VALEIKHHALAECLSGGVSHHGRRALASPTSGVSLSAGTRDLFISA
jgi:hypothetical protein